MRRSFEELDPRLFSFNSPHGWCEECRGFGEIWNRANQTGTEDTGDSVLEIEVAGARSSNGSTKARRRRVPTCHGARLNAIARHVRLQGQTIDEFTALLGRRGASRLLGKLRFRGNQKTIAADIVPEIQQRLRLHGQRRARLSRARPFGEDA